MFFYPECHKIAQLTLKNGLRIPKILRHLRLIWYMAYRLWSPESISNLLHTFHIFKWDIYSCIDINSKQKIVYIPSNFCSNDWYILTSIACCTSLQGLSLSIKQSWNNLPFLPCLGLVHSVASVSLKFSSLSLWRFRGLVFVGFGVVASFTRDMKLRSTNPIRKVSCTDFWEFTRGGYFCFGVWSLNSLFQF